MPNEIALAKRLNQGELGLGKKVPVIFSSVLARVNCSNVLHLPNVTTRDANPSEPYYNPCRLHSTLGYQSPEEFAYLV